MKKLSFFLLSFFICLLSIVKVYSISNLFLPFENKNKFGIWLWFIEDTPFNSHEELALFLSNLGIKRIYIKVGEGKYNPDKWPEIVYNIIPNTYLKYGIEPWAWSYNYPGNEKEQAKNLYFAAKIGYKGYVIDIEDEFENRKNETEKIFKEFLNTKQELLKKNIIDNNFKFYCTTFSNPKEKNIFINIIEKYVDGFMSQTYFEEWGENYFKDYKLWIDEINKEYLNLGCTKPVFHIISILKGKIPINILNDIISYAGKETSIWRIPSKNNKDINYKLIIDIIKGINWNYKFSIFNLP